MPEGKAVLIFLHTFYTTAQHPTKPLARGRRTIMAPLTPIRTSIDRSANAWVGRPCSPISLLSNQRRCLVSGNKPSGNDSDPFLYVIIFADHKI